MMLKNLICFLIISVNVIFAFESHSGELEGTYSTSIESSLKIIKMDSRANDNKQALAGAVGHSCHLGHCSFILSSYNLTYAPLINNQIQLYHFKVVSPFIEEDVRPPIFS